MAAAAEGIRQLKLKDLKPEKYTVRLFLAELNDVQTDDVQTDDVQTDAPVQIINIQGPEVLKGFDILAEATRTISRIVPEFDNVNIIDRLTLEMSATRGQPLISGIKIVRIP